jgi:hypothetical protein
MGEFLPTVQLFAQIFGYLYPAEKIYINFDKIMPGATFMASFFNKLIWSP